MIVEIKNQRRRRRHGNSEYEYDKTSFINLNNVTHITQIYEEVLRDSECGIAGDGVEYVEQDAIIHFVGGDTLRVESNVIEEIKEKL